MGTDFIVVSKGRKDEIVLIPKDGRQRLILKVAFAGTIEVNDQVYLDNDGNFSLGLGGKIIYTSSLTKKVQTEIAQQIIEKLRGVEQGFYATIAYDSTLDNDVYLNNYVVVARDPDGVGRAARYVRDNMVRLCWPVHGKDYTAANRKMYGQIHTAFSSLSGLVQDMETRDGILFMVINRMASGDSLRKYVSRPILEHIVESFSQIILADAPQIKTN